jgi:multimeric flavodoxin WrbA
MGVDMKVALINGSPKKNGGASGAIAAALQSKLTPAADCVLRHAANHSRDEIMAALCASEALVFLFPLYVDGIPSHLLRLLDEIQSSVAAAAPDALVYCIVNNGFYEARQNDVALALMRNFCVRSRLKWGQGLGVGAGGMIHAAAIGHGPMRNLGKALDGFSKTILHRETADDRLIEPNFPKFLYQMIAHASWRMQAKKYGLAVKRLYDKP